MDNCGYMELYFYGYESVKLALPVSIPLGGRVDYDDDYQLCNSCEEKCPCNYSPQEKQEALQKHYKSAHCQLCMAWLCSQHDFRAPNHIICKNCQSDFQIFVASSKKQKI